MDLKRLTSAIVLAVLLLLPFMVGGLLLAYEVFLRVFA